MSFLGLSIAGSALEAYQTAEDVTSQNIANVQTPGASRQQAILGQTPPIASPFFPNHFSPGTQGTGVYVAAITRVHQDSYDALFRGASSSQNFYDVQQQVLKGLQSALGEPNNGINTAYSNFQTAIQQLGNNPQGIAERNGVLSAAGGLVTALTNAGTALSQQQVAVKSQAGSLISTINSTIDQIAALNGQIRAATAVGDNPNTYKDQRDHLIDTLSTYVSTQTSVQADGSTLVTIDGHAIVNDTVTYHLATPVVGTNANGTPALKVGFVSDPNPTNPTALNVGTGQLGGLVDVYNNKLIPYGQSLDSFANGLTAEAARISQAGYDLTGQPGAQLFTPIVTQLPVSTTNIQVGITTASAFPAGLASTDSGVLVKALNVSNAQVDTTVNITAASSTLAAGTAPGATTFTVPTAAAAAAFAVGQAIVIGTGTPAQEAGTIASIAGNVITLTGPMANGHAAGDIINTLATSLNSPPPASLAGSITVGVDGITQTYDYSFVAAQSTSTAAVAAGAAAINVVNGASFAAGQKIVVGSGSDQELVTVTGVVGNTINITPLVNAHAANETVGGNASSINGFINSFNIGHFGVTASFDTTGQRIVFARDPTNVDLVHRALQSAAGNVTTPDFTLTDSNQPIAQPQSAPGTPAVSLLDAFGASAISAVNQNATNAYGPTSGLGANALLSLFSSSLGAPSLQASAPIPVGGYAAGASVTITGPAGNPPPFGALNVGDVLTVYDGNPPGGGPWTGANQENVTITAVNRVTNQITFTVQNAHPAANVNLYVTTAQTQTLQSKYSQFVAKLGLDTATAINGDTAQTTLASNVDKVRQSVDGINIDEETQNLIKFQNAYAAAAHVVNALNQMLQTAINLGS